MFYDTVVRSPRLDSTELLELRNKSVHVLDLTTTLPRRGLCEEGEESANSLNQGGRIRDNIPVTLRTFNLLSFVSP